MSNARWYFENNITIIIGRGRGAKGNMYCIIDVERRKFFYVQVYTIARLVRSLIKERKDDSVAV